ncbi:hypothetical protein [Pseudooceanicola sp. 200-1SW]|uniref:hypothetical protein n=1 Tax=Pseudooceanicola sp. 200-1SW TaxID=3425949 RepID=UPI003D7F485C
MNDPVSNVQIEDVLASIRKLVSEEVRAQTQPEEAPRKGLSAFGRAPRDEGEPAPQAAEKLILAPHLRVEDPAPSGADASLFADSAFDADTAEEAPFEEVSDEAALSGFDDAPVAFRGPEERAAPEAEPFDLSSLTEEGQDEAGSAETELTFDDETEEPAAEAEEDEGELGAEIDIAEMIASLEASHASSTDFADFGDGAAEALAAAQNRPAAAPPTPEEEAAEDARFDDLDAVLSHLEFDAEPTPRDRAASLRDEIEDAEVIEAGPEAGQGFEALFRRNEIRPEDRPESAVEAPQAEAPAGYRFAEPDPEDPSQDLDFMDGAEAADLPEMAFDAMPEHDSSPLTEGAAAQAPYEAEDEDSASISVDEEVLRELVSEILRQELQGALGERITRNVRKLVRREIQRALQSQDYI